MIEVLHALRCAIRLVTDHRVSTLNMSIDDHAGDFLGGFLDGAADGVVPEHRADKDHPVHLLFGQHGDVAFLLFRVHAGVTENDAVTQLFKFLLDGIRHSCIIHIPDVDRQYPNRL